MNADLPTNRGSLTRIRSHLPSLSPSESQVANWILQNPERVIRQSLAQVALECGVSDTTVLRLCRSLGFHGYMDLKISMAQDLATPSQIIHDNINVGDDPITIARKVFTSNISALQDTMDMLDGQILNQAVDLLANAKKILIIGVGTSIPIVIDMDNRLKRLGLPCQMQTDSYLQLMQAALMRPREVLVAISQSGSSEDPVHTAQEARRKGARVICITGNAQSPLTYTSDITLLSVSREVRAETIASRVAQITIVDALYVALSFRNLDEAILNERLIWEAVLPKTI